MRKYLSLVWVVLTLLLLGNTANAQTCPPVGPNIDIRFNNVRLDCANDSLFVDIELSNPTGTTYSVSSMSLRFTYNSSMLGNPHISQQIMAGSASIAQQNSIWSFGLVEFSAANSIPTGGAWRKVSTLGFKVNNFNAQGNSNCIDLRWNTTLPAITTAQQWVSFTCQPNMVFTSYGTNSTCIIDSCNTTSGVLELTALPTNVTCTGTNNGTVDLTVTGGTAPFSYLWSNGATTQDISSLAPGTYSVTVTDAASQTATLGSLVVGSSSLTVQYTVEDASCNQTDDGSITINNVLGGTPPFTYAWSNGATTSSISLLVAGIYNVTVTDANGCTGIVNRIALSEPAEFQYNVFINNISCAGGSDGELDFTLTGGTAPYTYLWVRYDLNTYLPIDTLGTTQDLSGLTSGLYGVEVGDANGCTGAVFFLLVEPDPINLIGLPSDVTPVSCAGGNDGSINISANGGTGVISFQWSNGTQTEDLENLTAGTYTVTATDLSGCTATKSFVVTQPDTISVVIDPIATSNVSCYGGNDGTINITVTGGNGGLAFAWSNGANTEDIAGLAAGTYSVTVSDLLGCQGALANIVVTQPDSLTLTATPTAVSCNAFNDGTVTLTVTGGTSPYTYNWGGGVSTANRSGLSAGTYTVTVTDAEGCIKTASVSVGTANCPPLARNDINNTLKNVPVSGDISTNDSDPDGDDLTFTVITGPSNGTLTAFNPATGTYTYTPNNNFVGEDSYTYYACDNGVPSLCDTATVYIEVLDDPKDPFNNPPVANADHFVTYVNTPIGSTVINNDYDPDTADQIAVTTTLIDGPNNGTFLVNPNGSFLYASNPGYVGKDTVIYQLCDNGTPGPKCDTAIVVITILENPNNGPGNLPPVAVDDAFYTELNTPVNGTVIPNDYDVDGNQISVTVPQFSGPSNGTLTLTPGGGFIYTPNPGYVGPDQFVYILCDNGVPSLCDTATAYILIQNPANQPPIARNDINNTLKNVPVDGDISTNDSDPDGDDLTFTVITGPSNGTLTSFDPATGTYTYTPDNNFVGEDTYTYFVCDNGIPSLCDTATVYIEVIDDPKDPFNNPPVANADHFITYINTPFGSTVINNDYDPDTADVITVTVTLIQDPSNGTIIINANGNFTYTPTTGFVGNDTLQYQICDNGTPGPKCDIATVVITVYDNPSNPSNLPPVAVDDAFYAEVNNPINGTVIPNDYDTDGNLISVTVPQFSGPSNGTLTINPDGSFTYVPNPNYVGPDQFVYILCDNGVPSLCDTATAYILIQNPANQPPLARNDINNTLVNTPVSGIVATNDEEPDGDNVVFGQLTATTNGTISGFNPATGAYTYTPNAGFIGTDVFTYQICDDGIPSLCDTATVTIHVIPPFNYDNNPPVANPDDYVTYINTPVTGTVIPNDFDPDTADIITVGITLITPPTNGTVTSINPNGTFTYVPTTGFVGDDTFTYVLCDNGNPSLCDTALVTVHVLPPNGGGNLPPVAVDDAYITEEGIAIVSTVIPNDYDQDGNTITVTVPQFTGPSNGTLTINPDGSFTYVPNPGYTGPDQFTYILCDNGVPSLCDTATAYITIYNTMRIALDDDSVDCFGAATGSIALTVINGNAPFTYLWSNGATTQNLTGVIAGIYSVTVTDAFGVTVAGTDTIGQPAAAIAVAETIIIPTCNGRIDASISIVATGGTAPYIYGWTGPAGFISSNEDITGLAAGTYNLTVTDANGCIYTNAYVVTQPDVLVATVDGSIHIACNGGNTGSIDISVAGGTPTFTYAWSGPNGYTATTQDITGLAVGTYTVTVTDINGCTATTTDTLTQNPELAVTADSITNVSCDGLANGAIDLDVTGGVAPYRYLWSNGATTQDITGLTAGTYSVTVTDGANCTGTSSFNVTQPVLLTASAIADNNVTCFGGNDGSIDLTVTGGTTPYTYIWSNGAITQDPSGLVAGTYNVTVTDAQGCTANASATITENPLLEAALIDSSSISCFGGNDGFLDITVSGGVGPYTYVWSNGATTQDLSGLTAGIYAVTVTDAVGCTDTGSATLTQPNLLVASIDDQTNVACNGGNTGAIDLGVTGGTTAYAYVWSNGATTQDISGLAIGTYTVTVTDAQGCTATATATITESAPLAIAATGTENVSCFGLSDGELDITVTGGVSPYTYVWSNGATTQDVTGLAAGTYSVTVTDAAGCTGTSSFTITQPDLLVATATVDQIVTCFGGNDGEVSLVVTGGTTVYTYVWSNGVTTQNLTGLAAGTYTVTVTDAQGCTATASATVTENPELVASLNASDDVNCFGGNDGEIDINVTGGVAPYTYVWSNGAITQDITGLVAGTYTVTVTDAVGCIETGSFTIGQPNLLVATIDDQTNVGCNGASTGAIDLGVTGGTTTYTYVWSNGATTQDISGLAAGTYTVTVTDAQGCTATATATITEEPSIVIAIDEVRNAACNGTPTGSIFLNISGGVPAYTFSWTGPGTYVATTQNISGLLAGTYNLTVTDANGCTATGTYTVTEPQTLTATATVDQIVTCFGGSDGEISLAVAGGTTAYTYLWSNGLTTQNLTGLAAGTYTVTVTDFNGCTATSSATVTENPELAIRLNLGTDASCFGGNDGAIDIAVTGGVAPYTYVWSNGATTADLTGLTAGTYNVTVTDAEGCTATGTFTIIEPTLLVATIDGQTDVACSGASTGAIDLGVAGGTPNYTYLWSNGATTQDITGLAVGTYTVTVTDANGCTATASATITENAPLAIAATATDNVSCFGLSDGTLDITVTGGDDPYTYVWSNGATTEDITGLVAGTYGVTVTDAAGCTAAASFTITQPNELTFEPTVTNVTCGGGSNGQAGTLVGGGTTPYTYAWSNGATTAGITGLTAGVYSVTVTDANGCTIGGTVTIVEENILVVNTAVTNATCGESNGVAGVTVSGGSGSFTYAWSVAGNTAAISGLAAGTYTVTVTDAQNGCTATRTLAVSGTSTLAVTPTVTNATCGAANGSATLAVTGGTPAYTYLWSNGNATNSATGLAAGTYSVTVNDANGCPQVVVVVVENNNGNLGILTNVNDATCGQSNGSATASVTAGTAPFTFAWSNGATAATASNLAAGTYFVTVSDASGCSDVATVNIGNLNGPSVFIDNLVNVSCANGSTGSVTISAVGGVGPYTYFWSNGESTPAITGLTAGTYTVTVTDANGCVASLAATVGTPDAIDVIVDATQVSCNNANNGSVTVRVSGGVGPYTFGWSNGASSQNLVSLTPGIYTVTVTDANGCNASTPATITQPTVLDVTYATTDVNCTDGTDGAIDLTVTGGTAPYTYAWSNGALTQDLTGLAEGLYTVTVTDANGCDTAVSISIGTLNNLVLNTAATNATCGQTNGVAAVSVSGGSGSFTYNWGTGNTASINNLAAGVYTVTVTDAVNGCTAIANVAVSGASDIDVTNATVDPICGGTNGSINLGVSGGTAPYTYAWSTPNGNGASAIGLAAGTYFATVTDAVGCQEVLILDLIEIVSLRVLVNTTDAACGQANGSASITPIGGTAPYTYEWSNGSNAASAANLTAGIYLVTITDANGCELVNTVTVNNVDGPTITIDNVTPLTCATGSTGSVSVSVTGGVGPYTYLWSNGATTEDLASLPSGPFSLTVTDANGCQASVLTRVSSPTAIEVITEGFDVGCNNASDGSINTVVSGGVGPYTYAWSNGPATANQSGLAVGTYTLTVTDANGCSVATPVVITQPDVLTATAAATGVTCNGGTNGTITTTVTGGTTPYAYQWSTGAITANLSGVGAGLYTVTITDANGCTTTASATVDIVGALVINLGITNATCGASNGAVDASVTGGLAPYTYAWSIAGTGNTQTGLAAGAYSLTVTDANGCSASTTAAVSATSDIVVTPTVTPVVCGSGNSGAISLAVTGGVAPYTYLWSNASTASSISGLAAGDYVVTVTDANGCATVLNIEVEETSPFTTTITNNPATCGSANGDATVTVTGGLAPYNYTWSNGAAAATASGLSAGLYQVTITDANGCSATEFVRVPNANGVAVSIVAIKDVNCGQADGAITIATTGGTLPYTYLWSNGATTANVIGLNAGTYAVTVTDANGCIGVAVAEVTPAEEVVFVADRDDVNCFGATDGSIAVSIVSGSGPFTYAWSPSGSGASLTNIGIGTYSVTVTAANGCSSTAIITLTQPNQLIATLDSSSNVTCNGLQDGTIDVTVAGGTAPYTYGWTPAGNTEDLTGLGAGTYTLVVTDANGCNSQPLAVTITEPVALTLNLVGADTVSCNGQADATATVAATGGTAPYTYDWSNGDNTATADSLSGGTYTVTATDANGCISNVLTVTIVEPTPIVISTLGTSNLLCFGGNNGEVNIKLVEGGTQPYTYAWSNNETGVTTIDSLVAGTYTVTVTDANGCTASASATLTNPAQLVVDAIVTDVTCSDSINDGSIELTITGGTGVATVEWSNAAQTNVIEDLAGGTYSVTVTDANGCSLTATYTVGVGNCNNPPIAVNDTVTTTSGTPVEIPVIGNDSDPDGDGITVTDVPTPPNHGTVTINPGGTITYTPEDGFIGIDSFLYTICDDGIPSLCDSAWVIVTVLPDRPNVTIPNGFSPDGDGINDNFEIIDISKFPNNKLIIMNRWGNTVYEAQPYNNDWNGVNQDGEPLPDGTYFYVLEINDGTTPPYTGFVVIHRGSNK